jgi:hypothetical protein
MPNNLYDFGGGDPQPLSNNYAAGAGYQEQPGSAYERPAWSGNQEPNPPYNGGGGQFASYGGDNSGEAPEEGDTRFDPRYAPQQNISVPQQQQPQPWDEQWGGGATGSAPTSQWLPGGNTSTWGGQVGSPWGGSYSPQQFSPNNYAMGYGGNTGMSGGMGYMQGRQGPMSPDQQKWFNWAQANGGNWKNDGQFDMTEERWNAMPPEMQRQWKQGMADQQQYGPAVGTVGTSIAGGPGGGVNTQPPQGNPTNFWGAPATALGGAFGQPRPLAPMGPNPGASPSGGATGKMGGGFMPGLGAAQHLANKFGGTFAQFGGGPRPPQPMQPMQPRPQGPPPSGPNMA